MVHADGLYIVEPDRHFPYECKRYSALIYKLVQRFKPAGYINMGDVLDCPQPSTYVKDPRRMNRLEEDIALVNEHWSQLEELLPAGAEVHLLTGNHEARLLKFMLTHAASMVGLMPSFPALYDLPTRNLRACRWRHHPLENWKALVMGDTVIHHGFYFDKAVALANLNRYRGYNFIQGHTHRIQMAYNDANWSASIGHGACSEQIAHTPTPNEHRQAVAFFTLYKGRGSVEIFHVDDGAVTVRGERITA